MNIKKEKSVYIIVMQILLSVLIIIPPSSCSFHNEQNYIKKFSKNQVKLNGKLEKFNCFIGAPTQIVVIDTLLLIVDSGEKLLKIIDIKNKKEITSCCNSGKGPNEYIWPIEINHNIRNNSLDILERSTSYLIQIPLKLLMNNFNTDLKKIHFEKTCHLVNCNDSLFIGVGFFNNRYALFYPDGKIRSLEYEYPDYSKKRIPQDLLFVAYQNNLAINNTGTKLVASAVYCDELEFFDVGGTYLKKTKKFHSTNVEFIDKSTKQIHVLHPSGNNKIGYLDICSCGNHVYCLYSGKTRNESERNGAPFVGSTIFAFDWNGNIHNVYKLDHEISKFSVDTYEKKIYALTNTPEPCIVTFSLNSNI